MPICSRESGDHRQFATAKYRPTRFAACAGKAGAYASREGFEADDHGEKAENQAFV